jgi:hypothetical protein
MELVIGTDEILGDNDRYPAYMNGLKEVKSKYATKDLLNQRCGSILELTF